MSNEYDPEMAQGAETLPRPYSLLMPHYSLL